MKKTMPENNFQKNMCPVPSNYFRVISLFDYLFRTVRMNAADIFQDKKLTRGYLQMNMRYLAVFRIFEHTLKTQGIACFHKVVHLLHHHFSKFIYKPNNINHSQSRIFFYQFFREKTQQ